MCTHAERRARGWPVGWQLGRQPLPIHTLGRALPSVFSVLCCSVGPGAPRTKGKRKTKSERGELSDASPGEVSGGSRALVSGQVLHPPALPLSSPLQIPQQLPRPQMPRAQQLQLSKHFTLVRLQPLQIARQVSLVPQGTLAHPGDGRWGKTPPVGGGLKAALGWRAGKGWVSRVQVRLSEVRVSLDVSAASPILTWRSPPLVLWDEKMGPGSDLPAARCSTSLARLGVLSESPSSWSQGAFPARAGQEKSLEM